ncbi:MAG: FtsX-like permease family protein [Lachnospiraceae bacterium]|nr:FtsX-like permease family protein [Lachnospiraceae bacterium]
MRMFRLAFINFRNSFRSYLSLVFSLAFTILVLFNFQNIIYSESFAVLGEHNKEYIDMLVQTVTVVLCCFMFFFLWYATNVFLTRRKREIGIYIFMGMSNRRIGSLYVIEISLVGITALVTGVGLGALLGGLFQMIMGAVSDIAVDVRFGVSWEAGKVTGVLFLAMYLFFALKGYWNITHSSVLSMISAARQNEYVRMPKTVLCAKAVLGVAVLSSGYYLANVGGILNMMNNLLEAVVLVIIGVYLLFGGLIPLAFQTVAANKQFLYSRQRCLWVNQMIFRMRKNYRTYAMVCIVGICSITALATGFAMKERYHNLINFDNQYTFQLLTNQSGLGEKAAALISGAGDIACQTSLEALSVDDVHLVLKCSEVKRVAQERGAKSDLPEPADGETFYLSHQVLMTFIFNEKPVPVTIGGKEYLETQTIRDPYIGYMQREMGCFYVVSDSAYERLKGQGTTLYIHNYKLADDNDFEAARTALDVLISNTEENFTARVAVDPFDNDLDWVRMLHALCICMFMVFVVASGCIMFMKLYNDSYEEKERYLVLRKLGFSPGVLSASIARELLSAYMLPFVVMAVSAYFSVLALGRLMRTSLLSIYVVSTSVVLVVFVFCYILSVAVYRRNVC